MTAKTRSTFNTDVGTAIYTNTGREVTGDAVRDEFRHLADSALFPEDEINIQAIAASKSLTMVGGCVYRLSMDSDGGAAMRNARHTSWYSANGAMPEAVVVIAEASQLVLHNGDDPTLPVWEAKDFTGFTITSVDAVNGQVTVGTTTGIVVLDYAADSTDVALSYTTSTTPAIVNNTVNDVALTVLPNAPIDPATGLPVITKPVATGGGLSVIADDGNVYDSAKTTACSAVDVTEDGKAIASFTDGQVIIYDLASISADSFTGTVLTTTSSPSVLGTVNKIAKKALGSTSGLTLLGPGNNMSLHMTSAYNSGAQVGDTKLATLSDTVAGDLVGGTVADRSHNNNALNVHGTITRTAVAQGSDLMGFSGFAADKYLEQPYNANLDFGTGDFCVMGWLKNSASSGTVFWRNDTSDTGSTRLSIDLLPNIRLLCGTDALNSTTDFDDGVWRHVTALRNGTDLRVYVNGVLEGTGTSSANITNASAILRVGLRTGGTTPLGAGSLSLLRMGATAPTAEQIAWVYDVERFWFQPDAKVVLPGTSDAILDLKYDKIRQLHCILTADYYVEMRWGTVVYSEANTGSWTKIAVSDGLVVKG